MARLHTTDGEFVGYGKLPNGLVSLAQAIIRKTTGHIPRQPWIPFSARKALERRITKDFFVWEIGAGFSTLWLAPRVGKLVSIEASKEWYERLSTILKSEGTPNVDLRFEWESDRMSDFSELADESLDLLFIDGGPRGLCLERGFSKVRHGGYLYLDNWDTKEFWGKAADFPAQNTNLFSESLSFIDYVPA